MDAALDGESKGSWPWVLLGKCLVMAKQTPLGQTIRSNGRNVCSELFYYLGRALTLFIMQ